MNGVSPDSVVAQEIQLEAFQRLPKYLERRPMQADEFLEHNYLPLAFSEADLEQAAAVEAWFVYNTAARPDMLPRKPMPKPQAGRGGRGGE